jgi:hypothetical protein
MPSLHRVRWLAVPLAAYIAITVILPAANGAARRDEFVRHALLVMAGCGAILGVGIAGGMLVDFVARAWRRP